MRASLVLLLGTAAIAAACVPTGGPPLGGASASPSARPATKRVPSSPVAASPLAGLASPTPAASTTPVGPRTTLRGTVRLDAGYLLGTGLAEALPGGGTRVRAGTLVSNNGGAVLANNGASVIANNGGRLISDRGGVLMTGGNNGTLISDRGGGLVSKTKYTLRQTTQVVGLTPIQGLMVAAVSLTTGEPLGLPAFTDAAGSWSLDVPDALAENVVVIAAVPGQAPDDPVLADPRLQFAVVLRPTADAAAAIDEDTALVGKYLRRNFVYRLRDFADAEDFAPFEVFIRRGVFFPEETVTGFIDVLRTYHDEARAAGHAALDDAGKLAMAQRATDAFLRRLDLDAIHTSARTTPFWPEPEAPAVATLATVLGSIRATAAARLAADPKAFEGQAFLSDPPNPATGRPFTIERPSDLGDYLVDGILVQNDLDVFARVEAVLTIAGIPRQPNGQSLERFRMRAATDAIAAAVADAYRLNAHGEQAALLAAIRNQPAAR